MSIAFFDFDGTITKKDSFLEFIIFVHGGIKTYFGLLLLSPFIILQKLGLLGTQGAKERVTKYFFAGFSEEQLKELGASFNKEYMDAIIKAEALTKIQWHQQEGHETAVVSASFEEWLQPWCDSMNMKLICSRLAYENGTATGQLQGKNCKGVEKVNRIRALYDLEKYDTIYAYGNSSGDKEMLEIAQEKFYRKF